MFNLYLLCLHQQQSRMISGQEIHLLVCAQIWAQDTVSNISLGVQLPKDNVKIVAGDVVEITRKLKSPKKGKMRVVCVEQRKGGIYLVGNPDKKEPPPRSSGPKHSAYSSCPLFVLLLLFFCMLIFFFFLM